MTEKTSKEAASAAARVLRDPNASKDAKSAAGSALTQYEVNDRLAAAAPALLEAAKAAVAYDQAIQSCANSPNSMSSYCTAAGDTLDSLYFDWLDKAHKAIAKAEGKEE